MAAASPRASPGRPFRSARASRCWRRSSIPSSWAAARRRHWPKSRAARGAGSIPRCAERSRSWPRTARSGASSGPTPCRPWSAPLSRQGRTCMSTRIISTISRLPLAKSSTQRAPTRLAIASASAIMQRSSLRKWAWPHQRPDASPCGDPARCRQARVSSKILEKPGKLEADEWHVMQNHAMHTTAILSRVTVLRDMAMIAGSHHERLDGGAIPAARRPHHFAGNPHHHGVRFLRRADGRPSLSRRHAACGSAGNHGRRSRQGDRRHLLRGAQGRRRARKLKELSAFPNVSTSCG
jgi:hypothetical protein